MQPPPRGQYYTPALRRSVSNSSQLRPARDNDEEQLATTGLRPRRQKSLVRPERERIDASHRQYHYRQHAANQGNVAPSATGNQPLSAAAAEDNTSSADPERRPSSNRVERRPTVRQMFLRRGKSILGREEKLSDSQDHRLHIAGEFSDGAAVVHSRKSLRERLPDPWLTYCRTLTCCIPGHLLTLFGMRKTKDSHSLISFLFSKKVSYMCVQVFLQGQHRWHGEKKSVSCPLSSLSWALLAS